MARPVGVYRMTSCGGQANFVTRTLDVLDMLKINRK